jgi:hypothetical protein
VSELVTGAEAGEALRAALVGSHLRACAEVVREQERQRRASLDRARRTVGEAFGVDPEWWCWAPTDLRWLIAEFKRGTAEVEAGRRSVAARPAAYGPTLVGDLWDGIRSGMQWLIYDASVMTRVLVALATVFVYGFALGRF